MARQMLAGLHRRIGWDCKSNGGIWIVWPGLSVDSKLNRAR
jgi:hypothetical protein